MSSLSAQGVVERASAELSKRINGLRCSGTKHVKGGSGSVMERVTNVFCGGGGAAATAVPEKPSRGVPRGPVKQKKLQKMHPPRHATWEQLIYDECFLSRLFLYFTPIERCKLAQVSCDREHMNGMIVCKLGITLALGILML